VTGVQTCALPIYKLRTIIGVRFESQLDDLPRIVIGTVRYWLDDDGTPVLFDVLADEGCTDGVTVLLVGDLKKLATTALNVGVTLQHRAWSTVVTAVQRDREGA
jgi:hypothetical protein